MSLSDPVADMLNRIRNAAQAKLNSAEMPNSKIKGEIARLLAREGYIGGYTVKGDGAHKSLLIELKYFGSRESTIRGVRRISKPGLRQYVASDGIPRVLGGMGIAILSTPRGLMTDGEARQNHVGGEVLCYVW